MGASALYYLAKAGCRDAVLIERETLAAGSTSKAAGGIRAQFSDELNIRISLECIRRFERFAEEPGGEIGFKQWGYLFLLDARRGGRVLPPLARASAASSASPRGCSPRARRAGSCPASRTDDLLAATFCPIDGYATPEAAVQGYATAAADARRDDRPGRARSSGSSSRAAASSAVETARGAIATGRVILRRRRLVAGARPRRPASTSRSSRRSGTSSSPSPATRCPRELPLTIDFATGFYFHREGAALLLRRPRADDRGARAGRRAPAAAARGARGSRRLVGLLRDEPGPQRDRRRRPGPGGPRLRDGLLRATASSRAR